MHSSTHWQAPCARCSVWFRPDEEMGQWRCRIHPGTLSRGVYTCCGAVRGAHDAAAHGVLSPATAVLATYEDESEGCLCADHCLRESPARGASNCAVVALYALAAQGGPRPEAILAQDDWVLRPPGTGWPVRVPYVTAYGAHAHVDHDLGAQALAMVKHAYADRAFLATLPTTERRKMLVAARLALPPMDVLGQTDEAILTRYWTTVAPPAKQPRVRLVVIRQAAPEREALTVKRCASLQVSLSTLA